MLKPLLIALCLALVCQSAYAEIPNAHQFVVAVAGEAEGCSAFEQEAIARAILNRGTLRGVFGYQRLHGATLPAIVEIRAVSALNKAMLEDVTNGATHWLSNWDLAHSRPSLIAWRKKMKETLVTKHFHFYKEA